MPDFPNVCDDALRSFLLASKLIRLWRLGASYNLYIVKRGAAKIRIISHHVRMYSNAQFEESQGLPSVTS